MGRQIQGRVNEGSNATVSEAKSLAEPPRRMKPNTIVMSSSRSENDETEAMERCKFKKREKGRGP
mgnify:CR=1 FL=1